MSCCWIGVVLHSSQSTVQCVSVMLKRLLRNTDKSSGSQRKRSYGVKTKKYYISRNFKFYTYMTQSCKVSDYRRRTSKTPKKLRWRLANMGIHWLPDLSTVTHWPPPVVFHTVYHRVHYNKGHVEVTFWPFYHDTWAGFVLVSIRHRNSGVVVKWEFVKWFPCVSLSCKMTPHMFEGDEELRSRNPSPTSTGADPQDSERSHSHSWHNSSLDSDDSCGFDLEEFLTVWQPNITIPFRVWTCELLGVFVVSACNCPLWPKGNGRGLPPPSSGVQCSRPFLWYEHLLQTKHVPQEKGWTSSPARQSHVHHSNLWSASQPIWIPALRPPLHVDDPLRQDAVCPTFEIENCLWHMNTLGCYSMTLTHIGLLLYQLDTHWAATTWPCHTLGYYCMTLVHIGLLLYQPGTHWAPDVFQWHTLGCYFWCPAPAVRNLARLRPVCVKLEIAGNVIFFCLHTVRTFSLDSAGFIRTWGTSSFLYMSVSPA